MYTDYFGLKCRPFEILPDSRFLYLSEQHSQAIANIEFALESRDSFVIITGEIGIGKTTILNEVVQNAPAEYLIGRLTHTTLTGVELLQSVLVAFGQPAKTKSKAKLVRNIRQFLIAQYGAGKHVVIAVDEAQNLTGDALEELRLLTGIDHDDKGLLTVVLLGQPDLSDAINSRQLENLRQRTRLRQHLKALSQAETREYLEHRMAVAGGVLNDTFDSSAIGRIYESTHGIPRLINLLCDTALTAVAAQDGHIVSNDVIDRVILELDWVASPPRISVEETLTPDTAPVGGATIRVFRIDDAEQHASYFIDKSPLLVGRSASNDLVIRDDAVSRRQALITRNDDNWMIEDLNSKNGMIVNGTSKDRHRLQPGDVIQIGHHRLLFESSGTANKGATACHDLPDFTEDLDLPGNAFRLALQ